MKRSILWIKIATIIILTLFWPELKNSVSSVGGIFDKQGTLSILAFFFYAILALISEFNEGGNLDSRQPRHSVWVRTFLGMMFVLGVLSLTDATAASIPSHRGMQAFFHLVALLGAAMIVADFIRSMIARLLK